MARKSTGKNLNTLLFLTPIGFFCLGKDSLFSHWRCNLLGSNLSFERSWQQTENGTITFPWRYREGCHRQTGGPSMEWSRFDFCRILSGEAQKGVSDAQERRRMAVQSCRFVWSFLLSSMFNPYSCFLRPLGRGSVCQRSWTRFNASPPRQGKLRAGWCELGDSSARNTRYPKMQQN